MSYLEGIGDEVLLTSIIGTVLAFIFLYTLLSTSSASTNVNTPTDLNSTQRIYQQVRDILGSPPEGTENVDIVPDPGTTNVNSDPKPSEQIPETEQASDELNPDSLEEEISEENEKTLRIRRIDFFENECEQSSTSTHPNTSSSKGSASTSFKGNVKNSTEDIGQTEVANSRSTSDNVTNVQSETTASRPNDSFNIRLKFLDDREQLVSGRPTELIGDFKRRHFAAELSNNKIVRLITNGQVLQDSLTLSFYHLSDGCVVHIQISNLAAQERRAENNSDNELDLGQFLWPLIGVILGCLWALHYYYKDHFNTSSTVALLGLSGLFLTVVWSQYSRTNEGQTGNSL